MVYMRTLYHRGVGVCHISKSGWIFILAVHDYEFVVEPSRIQSLENHASEACLMPSYPVLLNRHM